MVDEEKIVSGFASAFKDFLDAEVEDPRLGPLHISLFAAILHFYCVQEERIPISVFGKQLMLYAKISSNNTYYRIIRELHRYGYIYYIPSYNPLLGSLIYPLKPESK
jgi:hypothetical protein